MGWSCTAKAAETLDAVRKLIGGETTNELPNNAGFYETGKEQRDGAIVGPVWGYKASGGLTALGRFRISPEGKIEAFDGLPVSFWQEAERNGAASYAAKYGTWRERGAALLADLEAGRCDGKLSWSWFQSIFAEWQREAKIMFAAMPHATNEDMAKALRGMLSSPA